MEVLSRKSENVAEEKTCRLFSFLPYSLWRDLQQIISCLSLSRRLTCLLPLCAIWGQATMMHTAQRWHTQWENTLISARLNFTLEDSRSIYSLLNVPKNALNTCWWKDWKRTLTWSSDTGMTTEFSHSLYSIHFLWIPFMRNQIKANRLGHQIKAIT